MPKYNSQEKTGIKYHIEGTCQDCGEEYENISVHWSRSSECSHPPLSTKQLEILKGCMMGDGNLDRSGSMNPTLCLTNTNLEYISYVQEELGWLSSNINTQNTDFNPQSYNPEPHEIHRLNTRAHPELSRFNWYDDGVKKFPSDLSISATALKHWYCQDGSLKWNTTRSVCQAVIYSMNEKDRLEQLCDMISQTGFEPYPTNYSITFSPTDTYRLLGEMSPAPAGMEYKWETESWEKYKQKK